MTPPEVPRLRRNDGIAAVVDALEESGAVIVEDLLGGGRAESLMADVRSRIELADPDMEHVNDVLQTFYRGVRNVTGLAGKSPTFVEALLLDEMMLGAVDAIIGPECATYALNVGHLMVRDPGAVRQWLHRDQDVWSFLSHPHPEVEVSSVTALSEFTRENGATAVVPGSHRWDPGREPEEQEVAYAAMPAGGSVLYLGSTIHAGGANTTPFGRPGVHLSYVVGWLRTEENNTLATPPEIARGLPRRAQELLGYGMHDATAVGGGYLGCVDLRDPVDMLATGELGAATH